MSVYFCRFCTSSACPVRMPIFTARGTIWALCCYMCCTFASVARLLLGTIPCLVPFPFAEGAQDFVIVPRFFSHCCYTWALTPGPTHTFLGKALLNPSCVTVPSSISIFPRPYSVKSFMVISSWAFIKYLLR